MVAQSIAFAYAAGPQPYREDSPLDPAQRGVISLESQVLDSPMDAVVLRYGRFYGAGTGFDARRTEGASLHVDAAADAARRALTRGQGIYNPAEDDGVLSIRKAVEELDWDPAFRTEAVVAK
jgi:hypothetical protein